MKAAIQPNRARACCVFLSVLLAACINLHPTLSRVPDDGVILAFGDSLTAGVGAPPGSSYPEVLEDLIGRRVIRSGVSGETSAEGLVRLPRELALYKPKLVLLCLGANDILRKMDLRKTAENIIRMIRMVRDSGAEVVLIGVPKPGLFLSTAGFYKEISKETGTPLEASLLADVLAQKKLKADPVHPNGEGYRVLAEGLAGFLRKAGAVP